MRISCITFSKENFNSVGNRNQVLGVAQALQRIQEKTGIKVNLREWNFSDNTTITDYLSAEKDCASHSDPHVVIGASAPAMGVFYQLADGAMKNSRPVTYVLLDHSGLMSRKEDVFSFLSSNIKNQLAILATPEHIIDYQTMPKILSVRTHGVAHTVTQDAVDTALAKWRHTLAVEKDQPVIVVMVGGRTPEFLADRIVHKYFTAEETGRLGGHVGAQAEKLGATVLASNSVRANAENITAFGNAIEKSRTHGAFFPFKATDDDIPFKALLGLVRENPSSRIYITGDSVSMPSEAASVILPSQLYLYPVSNQNPDNTQFVDWMHRTGRAGIAQYDSINNRIVETPCISRHIQPMDASHQVAKAISTHLNRSGYIGGGQLIT